MRGSLDDPPIVISISRRYAALGLAGSLVIVVASAAQFLKGAKVYQTNAEVFCVVACLVAFCFVWRLFFPGSLVLSPDGLIWNTGFVTRRWRWNEVENFRLVAGNVCCDVSNRSTLEVLRPINKKFFGSHGSLGDGWEGCSSQVVDVLNAARARWLQQRN